MAIDWLNVLYNTFWIIGLALILAAFSYADWQAARRGLSLRQASGGAVFYRWPALGLMLVSLGLMFLAAVWWERLIWLAFAALFAVQGWQTRRTPAAQHHTVRTDINNNGKETE
ncbi:MAG: hypothetical protein ACE5G8_05770 [Anaerolineae bacterium]